MVSDFMIVPLTATGAPDLPIDVEAGETLVYSVGTSLKDTNDMVRNRPDETVPPGYHTVLDTFPLFNDADPPVITGYDVHATRTSLEPVTFGGFVFVASARGGVPIGIIRVHSRAAVLDMLNTRLRALVVKDTTGFYGRIPMSVNAAGREGVASKFDELADVVLVSRPAASTALTEAANMFRDTKLVDWNVRIYDILATLFQLPSRASIIASRVGEPE